MEEPADEFQPEGDFGYGEQYPGAFGRGRGRGMPPFGRGRGRGRGMPPQGAAEDPDFSQEELVGY